ncbi:hypothetical protein C8R45DRAFT_1100875 [Mycena sanguinolenta]|nr:hypothetical protein C8R45DRAFT_1100875 [Mycena sanguinolenta]
MPHTLASDSSSCAICGPVTSLQGGGCQNTGYVSNNMRNPTRLHWILTQTTVFLDNASPSSLLFFVLSLIPGNALRYIALVLAVISLGVYSIYGNPFSARLTQVNNFIVVVDGILTRAKAECMRDHILLAECETGLMRTKLSASEIHSQILEIHAMSWKHYLQNRFVISKSLARSERELRAIQTSLLVGFSNSSRSVPIHSEAGSHQLLIEAAHQRKLAEDLNLNTNIVVEVPFSSLFVLLKLCLAAILTCGVGSA